ncbi:MAG: DUF1822 family protein [Leptolyngbya sp. SIO1D8]|nr:DUF1822 family protein [Leptolyngbya sp. SIO1D8]
MTFQKTTADDARMPIWVTQAAQQTAQQFARQQPDPQKAEQVYRNTLAVCIVNGYLNLLGIKTDLAASDSWNPAVRLMSNVADLLIVDKGRIDCRPVKPEAETCWIPLEAHSDRIGYIIVRLDTDQEATLLGFVEQVNREYLPLQQLRPISELPKYLAQVEPVVNLRHWLEGLYQLDWQPPEKLLQPKQLALSHSQTKIQRAKCIELNLASEHRDVVLLLSVTPHDEVLSVRVQLHPFILAENYPNGTRLIHSAVDCLMPNIKLALQAGNDTPVKEVVSRTYPRDNCIQIPQFQGHWGECFTVQITVNAHEIKEHFQL